MENNMNIGFASDNYASVNPKVLQRLLKVDQGNQIAYGADESSSELAELVRERLGSNVEVFPVFNGTGGNVLALSAALKKYQGVICAETSHLNTDEGGAPEVVAGIKLYKVSTSNGKLTPESILKECFGFDDLHRAEPKVISLAMSTETGLIYTIEELIVIRKLADENDLYLHVDGARIFNGCAALGISVWEFIERVKPDIITVGGTKVGAMLAECIISLNPEISKNIYRLRKSYMQLGSKQRYISAQLLALLENSLGVELAGNANAQAYRLYEGVKDNQYVKVRYKPSANALFVELDSVLLEELQKCYRFYLWDESCNLVRWMTSWQSTEEEVDSFIAKINEISSNINN